MGFLARGFQAHRHMRQARRRDGVRGIHRQLPGIGSHRLVVVAQGFVKHAQLEMRVVVVGKPLDDMPEIVIQIHAVHPHHRQMAHAQVVVGSRVRVVHRTGFPKQARCAGFLPRHF